VTYLAGLRKNFLRNSFLILVSILLFSSFSYAALPDGLGGVYACWALCQQGNTKCMGNCVNPAENLAHLWAEERARCAPGCNAAEAACHASCEEYERIPMMERPLPDDFDKIMEDYDDWDDYKKDLEEKEKIKQQEKEAEEEEDDELTVSRFVINAPTTFDIEKDDLIKVEITAYGKDSKGVEKLCVECSLGMWGVLNNRDKEAKEYMSFDVEMLNSWTDSSGKAKLNIVEKFVKINDKRVLKLYNTITKDYAYIDVIPKPKSNIKIKSFTLTNSRGVIPQDSWGLFNVEVEDEDNRLKAYYVTSNAPGTSWIRYDGVEYPEKGKIITNKNSISFGWSSPKITKEVSMDYTKRLIDTAIKIAASEAAFKQGEKVTETFKNTEYFNKLDLGTDAEALDILVNKVAGTVVTGKTGYDLGKSLLEDDPELAGQTTDLKILKVLVNGLSGVRGVLGIAGKLDATGTSRAIDAGITITQDLLAVVDDMTRLANAQDIHRNYTITIVVEDLENHMSAFPMTKVVTVEGLSKKLE